MPSRINHKRRFSAKKKRSAHRGTRSSTGGIPSSQISSSKTTGTLTISLNKGQKIVAEPGTLGFGKNISKGDISVKTTTKGVFKAVKRYFSGETVFLNTYTSHHNGVKLGFIPKLLGDIHEIQLSPGEKLRMTNGAFLASTNNITIGGMKFSARERVIGNQLFLSTAQNTGKGKGKLFITGFGEIIRNELQRGETLFIDNGLYVASTIPYKFSTLSGKSKFQSVKSFVLGGEGILMKFYGPGVVYYQSRNLDKFKDFIRAHNTGGGKSSVRSGAVDIAGNVAKGMG